MILQLVNKEMGGTHESFELGMEALVVNVPQQRYQLVYSMRHVRAKLHLKYSLCL